MTDFDQVLTDCLDRIAGGASTPDECLARHPGHAAQLEPLLQAAAGLARGREVRPSPAFKAGARARLTAHMRAHPRTPHRRPGFWRLAVSFAAVTVLFIGAGTAYAQSALPGDLFYDWKLASEGAWRLFAADQLGADLTLADRRLQEWRAAAGDPARGAAALDGYLEVLNRLESRQSPEDLARILPALQSHQDILQQGGLSVPELDDFLADETGSVPVEETPEISPGAVPGLVETVVPDLLDTLEDPLPLPLPIP